MSADVISSETSLRYHLVSHRLELGREEKGPSKVPLRETKVDYECSPVSFIGRGDAGYFFKTISFKGM